MTGKPFESPGENKDSPSSNSPLHEESMNLLYASMLKKEGQDSKPQSSGGGLDTVGKLAHLGVVAGQALLYSAIQQPVDGAVQLATMGKVSAPRVIAAPEQAKFGTADWTAETLGSGVGMVAPFMASDYAVGKLGNALKDTSVGESLARLPLAERLAPFARPMASGALYGFALTPSDPHGNLIGDRLRSATVAGVTFGAQRAISVGLMDGLPRVPLSQGLLETSAGRAITRFGTNLVGGAGAGLINANLDSLLSSGHFASGQDSLQSVVAFTATGGALDLAHAALGRSAGTAHDRPANSTAAEARDTRATQIEPADAGKTTGSPESHAAGGSGSMMEVINRINNGSEADQQASGIKNSPAVLAKAGAFESQIDGVIGKTSLPAPEHTRLADQFRSLTKELLVREWDTQGMEPNQIATTFDGIQRVLSADKPAVQMNPAQRVELARQMLEQAAKFPVPDTGDAGKNDVLAIMQTLQYKYPGSMSLAIADLVTTGEHTTGGKEPVTIKPDTTALAPPEQSTGETHVQQLMHALGVGSIADIKGSPADTPQLQRMYERLSGTEKGGDVIKNGAAFVLRDGDGTYRLYRDDTNYFRWKMAVNGNPVMLTHADITRGYQGRFLQVPNPGAPDSGNVSVTADMLVRNNGVDEQIHVQNQSHDKTVTVNFAQQSDVPMRDMFQDRGWARSKTGSFTPAEVDPRGSVTVNYTGLDGKPMRSRMTVEGMSPTSISTGGFSDSFVLKPGENKLVRVRVDTAFNEPLPKQEGTLEPFDKLVEQADQQYAQWAAKMPAVESDNPTFNKVWDRAMRDMYILRQPVGEGEAIDAGIPWFACPFGRDDLITAHQMLPYHPELSRDVLRFLAAHQGTVDDPQTAQKPGKILHEFRMGEMGRNHEIPFAPYYGSVDSTPLFLNLLADYVHTTGDLSLARELQPNVQRALDFLNSETQNGTDYLRYGGRGNEALSNQGWKDSGDSVMNSQGELVKGPIALSEVQGYLYDAWTKTAQLQGDLAKEAAAAGDNTTADQLRAQQADLSAKAQSLKDRFGKDFWMPKKNFVALALDGKNQQADVVASNPGHILSKGPDQPGLLTSEQEQAVKARLMAPDMFSGYGIKTLSATEARHFDNSYHNGSVWPHDNSMITPGLPPAAKLSVFNGMYSQALHDPNLRLAELIGGYPRDKFGNPVPYPVACVPQAWAVGTIPSMLLDVLGLTVDGRSHSLSVNHPLLPDGVNQLTMRNFHVGDKSVDLHFTRTGGRVDVQVLPNAAAPADAQQVKVSINNP